MGTFKCRTTQKCAPRPPHASRPPSRAALPPASAACHFFVNGGSTSRLLYAKPAAPTQDRPPAKALGRNWRRPFGAFPCWAYKKESGFGLLVSRRSRQRNSRCRPNRNKKVTKIRPDVTDREASPDAPPDFFLIFFWSSRPEHNQRPPTDTAKRRFALIPTRRKIAVSPLGAQSTPPLAGGRSQLGENEHDDPHVLFESHVVLTTDTDPIDSQARGVGWVAWCALALRERARLGGKCQKAPWCCGALVMKLRSSCPPVYDLPAASCQLDPRGASSDAGAQRTTRDKYDALSWLLSRERSGKAA